MPPSICAAVTDWSEFNVSISHPTLSEMLFASFPSVFSVTITQVSAFSEMALKSLAAVAKLASVSLEQPLNAA